MHVVRSDIAHGTLEGLDFTAASAHDGVVAVFEARDLSNPPLIPIRVGSTPELEAHLQPVIATHRIRYVGEPLAIVLAETAEIAEEAAALVWADIGALPPVTTIAGKS